jgi:hypothetical protein
MSVSHTPICEELVMRHFLSHAMEMELEPDCSRTSLLRIFCSCHHFIQKVVAVLLIVRQVQNAYPNYWNAPDCNRSVGGQDRSHD